MNVENVNLEYIEAPRLPQLKFYLKIICISYLMENTNMSDFIKSIIKSNHIFNNLSLKSKPQVIETLSKSDIAIIQVDIWNTQSVQKAKNLINRCFNIGSYIVTIHDANMIPSALQCKNCWKWDYTTFACQIQELKYIKYNGSYKSEHH